jgi:hypothetical protein
VATCHRPEALQRRRPSDVQLTIHSPPDLLSG